MPVNKNAFLRYMIIDAELQTRSRLHTPLKIFKEKIEEKLGEKVSDKTLKNDIAILRGTAFKAPIAYMPNKGYYYQKKSYGLLGEKFTDNDIQTLTTAYEIVQQFSGLQISEQFKKLLSRFADLNNQTPALLIDIKPNSGQRNLDLLANAIRNMHVVVFTYQKYILDDATPNTAVSPLILKEHTGIWYLVAWHNQKHTYRHYALDRMGSIRIDPNQPYYLPPNFNPGNYFKHSIGITAPQDEKPVLIKLKIYEPCMYYILDNPWHTSQQIIERKPNYILVTYHIFNCTELLKEILAWCKYIQVLEPTTLRETVLEHLRDGVGLNE